MLPLGDSEKQNDQENKKQLKWKLQHLNLTLSNTRIQRTTNGKQLPKPGIDGVQPSTNGLASDRNNVEMAGISTDIVC